jgi:hypothetical protein
MKKVITPRISNILIKVNKILINQFQHSSSNFSSSIFDKLYFARIQNQVNQLLKIMYHGYGTASYYQFMRGMIFLAKDEARKLTKSNIPELQSSAKVWMKRAKNIEHFIKYDMNKGVYDD